jgi:hypothetical protein
MPANQTYGARWTRPRSLAADASAPPSTSNLAVIADRARQTSDEVTPPWPRPRQKEFSPQSHGDTEKNRVKNQTGAHGGGGGHGGAGVPEVPKVPRSW